jgi:hypothetical protein
MKRLSWKYIAGIVDGEGCIDFQLNYHKDYPGKPYIAPRLRIAFSVSSKFILDMLLANHGGNLRDDKRSHKNSAWQDAAYWTLQGKALRPFLQNIVNHLYIKKEQAKLAIWMIDNVVGKHVNEEVREHLRQEMKAMKRDPHRLSEVAVLKADEILVEIVESKPWSREHDKCVGCGTTENRYGGNGYCAKCYPSSRPIEAQEAEKERRRIKAREAWHKKKALMR